MKVHILVVEHDAKLTKVLRDSFEAEGFRVSHATTLEQAERLLAEDQPHLVIAGAVPRDAPLELLGRITRGQNGRNIGVIMLSATREEADRVEGLSSGADDYVTVPFSRLELVQRSKAVLRRRAPNAGTDVLRYRDIELDRSSHQVRRGLRRVLLGPTEFRLLQAFLEYPGRIWTRAQLIAAVWDHADQVGERTVDVHIGRLRKALTRHLQSDVIETVRGVGYAFRSRD